MTAAAELAGASAQGGEQGGQQAAEQPNPWGMDSLQTEDRGWIELKGYKGTADLVRAHRGLEKMLGGPRDRLLKLPEKDDAPEWGEVFGRLGRPETPDGYELQGADAELLARAHAAGLSKRQVQALAGYLGERGKAAQEKQEAERAERADADVLALKREWGAEFDLNVQHGKRAVQALGWDEQTIEKLEEALGTKATYQLAARIGRGLAEHSFVQGDNAAADARGGFGMSVAAAREKFQSMAGDPEFQKRLMSEDPTVRRAAVQERERIAQLAFPNEEQPRVSVTA